MEEKHDRTPTKNRTARPEPAEATIDFSGMLEDESSDDDAPLELSDDLEETVLDLVDGEGAGTPSRSDFHSTASIELSDELADTLVTEMPFGTPAGESFQHAEPTLELTPDGEDEPVLELDDDLVSEEPVLELTEAAGAVPEAEPTLDLTEAVDEGPGGDEPELVLDEPVEAAPDAEDDAVLELTEAAGAALEAEPTLDLTEAVDEGPDGDEPELVLDEAVEAAPDAEDDAVLELTEAAGAPPEAEPTLDLTEAVDEGPGGDEPELVLDEAVEETPGEDDEPVLDLDAALNEVAGSRGEDLAFGDEDLLDRDASTDQVQAEAPPAGAREGNLDLDDALADVAAEGEPALDLDVPEASSDGPAPAPPDDTGMVDTLGDDVEDLLLDEAAIVELADEVEEENAPAALEDSITEGAIVEPDTSDDILDSLGLDLEPEIDSPEMVATISPVAGADILTPDAVFAEPHDAETAPAANDQRREATTGHEPAEPAVLRVAPEQLDAALERVVERMFADRIEGLMVEVVERVVGREIERLRTVIEDLLGQSPR